MREIKFRAWDKDKEKMTDDFVIGAWNGNIMTAGESGWTSRHGRDLILMESTSLKDKNGKEIYEGDILKGEYGEQSKEPLHITKGEVLFNRGKYEIKFNLVWRTLDLFSIDGNNAIYWREQYNRVADEYFRVERIEIIGNIYENPDLLEVK